MAIQIVLNFDSKICKICRVDLPLTLFNKDRRLRDGLAKRCKTCEKTRMARYYADPIFRAKLKAKVKIWQAANKERVREIKRKSAIKNRAKIAQARKRYKRQNRDKINAATRRRYQINIERKRAEARRFREQNRARRRDMNRNQYHKDIEKSRAIGRRNAALRKARLIVSSAGFSEMAWIQKCEYWGWRCYLCRAELNFETATLDHRIPVVKGGPHVLSNLAPACHHCNCSKRHTGEAEYRRLQNFSLTTASLPRL